ncbi:hypothetical protein [uncultured Psychroserpens sp.]|uniref:hypothetical protein n=1 Tax=uncultured Psychroserpens sp. TaxID=255436 RepID=UPI002636D7DA|nr:hypothetical protein [uncultured Psychroserpens sp.]
MNKRIVLSDEQLFDAIYQTLFFFLSFIPLFLFEDLVENEILNKAIYYILILVVISAIKISKRVSIHNGFVVKDLHTLFLGSIKKMAHFPISEIGDIVLNQNEELYFEITAKRKNGTDFIFKTLPNKNPALKELELIKSHLRIQ